MPTYVDLRLFKDFAILALNITTLKKPIILVAILFIILTACKKDASILADKNKELYEKYGGDYRLESAIAGREVDINLDGIKNLDMVRESIDFTNSKLWIRISKTNFLFEQMWPEQYPYFYEGKILHVNFANQGDVRSFEFANNNTTIVTDSTLRILNNIITKAPPLSIRILDNKTIEVVNKKRLHTNEGIEDITFTSVYSYTGYNKGYYD